MEVPTPANVSFGTVNPKTGTWVYKDKALGAGVAIGPDGAALLTGNATTVQSSVLPSHACTKTTAWLAVRSEALL